MKITIFGSGPAVAIPRKGCRCMTCKNARKKAGKSKRTRSSIIIQKRNFNFLIDCSPDFLEQAGRERIKRVDAVVLTHLHFDAAGGLKKLDGWTDKKIPVWTEKKNMPYIRKKYKGLKNLELNILTLGRVKKIGPYKVAAYRVLHGLTPGFPTVGYKIDARIGYLSDMGKIPKSNLKYFMNLDLLFLDCAMYFGRKIKGHLNPAQAIEYIKVLKPKKVILTQIGHGFPPHIRANREIQEYRKKKKIKSKIILGFDGMKIKI